MVVHKIRAVLISISLIWLAAPAVADSLDGDRFSLSLGVFITDRDTVTSLDSSFGDGTDVDFEDDLGLASSDNVFRLDETLFAPRNVEQPDNVELRNRAHPFLENVELATRMYAADQSTYRAAADRANIVAVVL